VGADTGETEVKTKLLVLRRPVAHQRCNSGPTVDSLIPGRSSRSD
jgi:hypothetical protein